MRNARLVQISTMLVVLVGVVGSALAEGSAEDKAAAEALFQQGRKLLAAGKAAEACPKFASSQQLDPGTGTLLNLADCYEKNGQLASAWATFKDAATSAKSAGQIEREATARQRAALLEPRLPQLVVQVPASGGVAEVTRDDAAVPKEIWGTPLPLDPGSHLIKASGPGRRSWTQRVVAVEAKSMTLSVPSLEVDPSSSASPPPEQRSGQKITA